MLLMNKFNKPSRGRPQNSNASHQKQQQRYLIATSRTFGNYSQPENSKAERLGLKLPESLSAPLKNFFPVPQQNKNSELHKPCVLCADEAEPKHHTCKSCRMKIMKEQKQNNIITKLLPQKDNELKR